MTRKEEEKEIRGLHRMINAELRKIKFSSTNWYKKRGEKYDISRMRI